MDSKKIQEAAAEARRASAETLTTFGAQHSIDDVVALTDMRLSYDEVAESAFEKGAEWLLTQPLSERLTEGEKAKIRESYWQAASDWIGIGDARGYCRTCVALESIFGTSLFNDKSE